MYRFFINRPIVAMVIAILMVLVGPGLDAHAAHLAVPQHRPAGDPHPDHLRRRRRRRPLEQSVATPIEEQMSGVDNMNYMYSISANNGVMRMVVNFDVKTDPNMDQVLAQLRETQAEPQLPADVRNYGVTLLKSPTAPMMLVALYSPKGTYDATFLANYAYINIVDQMTRLKGISNIGVFGAGQYAMRFWVRPDQLAKLNVTVNDMISAINAQNTVNPAGQVGGPPSRQRPGIHLRHQRPGPPDHRRGIRRHRHSRKPGRLGRAAQGRGAHRTGRADSTPSAAGSTASLPPSWPSINCPAPTRSTTPTKSASSWSGLNSASLPTSIT